MSSSADIGKIDSNLAVKNSLTEGMDIYSVDAENMELFGFYWRKPGNPSTVSPLPWIWNSIRA